MNRFRFVSLAAAALVAQTSTGCATMGLRHFRESAAEAEWPTTLDLAQSRAQDGRYDAADSGLADFAARYPGSPEALETAYWRALLKADPSNPHASLPTAVASLEAYLKDARPHEHQVEALSLRRIALQLDGLTKVAATATAQAKDASTVAATAKAQAADANARADAAKSEPSPSAENEIRRLKDELAKANAELERIRKRLSTPPPKQP